MSLAEVRCPNCEHRFIVRGAPVLCVAEDELIAQLAAHFAEAHPGEKVGTTETA